MKNENTRGIVILCIVMILVSVLMQVSLMVRPTAVNNSTQAEGLKELLGDELTFTGVSNEIELEASGIQTVYDEEGNEFVRATFSSNRAVYGDFECEIPVEYAEQIDKNFYYKGTVYLAACNEYYDELLSEIREQYGDELETEPTLIELIESYPAGSQVFNIEFVFSDYIVESEEDKMDSESAEEIVYDNLGIESPRDKAKAEAAEREAEVEGNNTDKEDRNDNDSNKSIFQFGAKPYLLANTQ